MASSDGFSKHLQTIVVSLATGALGYLGYAVQESTIKIAVLAEKVDKLERRYYAEAGPYTPSPSPLEPAIPVHALPASLITLEPRRK